MLPFGVTITNFKKGKYYIQNQNTKQKKGDSYEY